MRAIPLSNHIWISPPVITPETPLRTLTQKNILDNFLLVSLHPKNVMKMGKVFWFTGILPFALCEFNMLQ